MVSDIQPATHFCSSIYNAVDYIYLHIMYGGCFYTTTAELSNWERDHMAHKAKNIYYWSFVEKV